MSRASRQKGQRGEREICKLLAEKFGGEFKRNLSQTQDGGYDVLGLDGFAIEVKFQEKLSIEKWYKQAVDQAEEKTPVLFFRRSREPWRVALPGPFNDKPLELFYSIISVESFVENINDYRGKS